MKNKLLENKFTYILIIMFILPLFIGFVSAKHNEGFKDIEHEKENWKQYYQDYKPTQTVTKWLLPFKIKNRSEFKNLAVVSSFRSFRVTYLYGHKHSGLDCLPAHHDSAYVEIYPVADGVVCDVFNPAPRQTVLVKHLLPDSSIIYTAYVHLKEIYVKNGDIVTPDTKLGRIYTKEESKKYRGNYYHLHFEVRKSFDDYGCASWLSMTNEELDKRFEDPLLFLKKVLGSGGR